LPVVKGGSRAQKIDASIKSSHLWQRVKKFKLTKNLRANANAQEFAKFIRNVGRDIPNSNEPEGKCRLPKEVCTKQSLAGSIFGPLLETKDYAKVNETAILAPLNAKVEEINEEILEMMEGHESVFYSQDATSAEHEDTIMTETLNVLRSASLPPYELKLKINAVVMLIRNLNIMSGLCNGTRLQVLNIGRHIVEAMILTGDKSGDVVILPRITVSDDLNFPFPVHRHQFPIKLAFAMTINKSQGQTFKRLGIDLTTPVFDHGQLYTALSRAPCWDAIKVRLAEDATSTVVENIVYHELLEEDDEEPEDRMGFDDAEEEMVEGLEWDDEDDDNTDEEEGERGMEFSTPQGNEMGHDDARYWNWAYIQYLRNWHDMY
jgi:hypothetical protein